MAGSQLHLVTVTPTNGVLLRAITPGAVLCHRLPESGCGRRLGRPPIAAAVNGDTVSHRCRYSTDFDSVPVRP